VCLEGDLGVHPPPQTILQNFNEFRKNVLPSVINTFEIRADKNIKTHFPTKKFLGMSLMKLYFRVGITKK